MKKLFLLLFLLVLLTGCTTKKPEAKLTEVKLGYFPNLTHAQALVGVNRGDFQAALGDVKITSKTFNAGPAEIEALFAGEIDLGYIGPSPAINGYIKSEGQALRIISGSNSGGAVLVGQPELTDLFLKENSKALIGKKIASPQQGNTQDISLRHYLKENNLTDKAQIIPIANADQLTMFAKKEIDAAWAPEPWAARLINEAGAKILIDERNLWENSEFCTTNIIVRTEFLNTHPDIVKKFLIAHRDVTNWILINPSEAQKIVNQEIEKATGKKLADQVLIDAWSRLDLTIDPLSNSVKTFAQWAFEAGFLGETAPDLTNLYDLTLYHEITNQ